MREAAQSPGSQDETTGTLTMRDREILDFERDWRAHAGEKENAIRERFGFSAARYYQLLARLIDLPTAHQYDPLLLARLRRRRDARVRRRTAGALGHPQD
jgi:hypothetical protein